MHLKLHKLTNCYKFSYNRHYNKLISVLHTALCGVVDVEHWQLGLSSQNWGVLGGCCVGVEIPLPEISYTVRPSRDAVFICIWIQN